MFTVPEVKFDPTEHARNKAIRSNQFFEMVLSQFRSTYDEFWGVSGSDKTTEVEGEQVTTFVGGGSRYTVTEMQSILAAMPMATAIDILTGTAQFVVFIEGAYPGVLADRYKTAAFTYTLDQSGIVLTALSAAWSVPEKE